MLYFTATDLSPCSAFPSAGRHFNGSRDSFLLYDQFPQYYNYDYSFYFQTTALNGVILFSYGSSDFYSIYMQDGYVNHKINNGGIDGRAQLKSSNTFSDGLDHFVWVTKCEFTISIMDTIIIYK